MIQRKTTLNYLNNRTMEKTKDIHIAFTGPSGAGKTTLVNHIKQRYGIPHLNGSSGGLKTEQDVLALAAHGLQQGHGHAAVIRSGHQNPLAGFYNQQAVLKGRLALLQTPGSWVTDRSPIDNIVYFLMQCGPYVSEKDTEEFITSAMRGVDYITHLIYVKPLSFVEDNGSRIPNLYYQRAVDSIFQQWVMRIQEFDDVHVHITQLGNYSLEQRLHKIESFLDLNYSLK